MAFYSENIGPYPYEKLADVEAAGMGGGMEHASEIFSDRIRSAADPTSAWSRTRSRTSGSAIPSPKGTGTTFG